MDLQRIQAMTNEELSMTLKENNITAGPITDTTRRVYERKLARVQSEVLPVQLDPGNQHLPNSTRQSQVNQPKAKKTGPKTVFQRSEFSPVPITVNQAMAEKGTKMAPKRKAKDRKEETLALKKSKVSLSPITDNQYLQSSPMDIDAIQALTDQELVKILKENNIAVGPITDTTRLVYARKLAKILSEVPPVQLNPGNQSLPNSSRHSPMGQEMAETELKTVFQKSNFSLVPITDYQHLQNSPMHSQDIQAMTNKELELSLKENNVSPGPITDTTRLVYERKLARIQSEMSSVQFSPDTTRLVYERKLARIQSEMPPVQFSPVSRAMTRTTRSTTTNRK